MMQADLKTPLSKAEQEQLAAFLGSPEAPSSLGFVEAHGLLTAVVSAPGMVMPSIWQPIILGDTEFETREQGYLIMGLVMRLFNQIVTELGSKRRFKPPGYPEPSAVERWSRGYLVGAKLDVEWRNDDYGISMLLPFGVLAGQFDLTGGKDQNDNIIEDQTGHLERYRQELPDRVQELHDHYLRQRRASMRPPTVQRRQKVGRNDPCPCGSGKKYKKCCGVPGGGPGAPLH